MKAKRSASEELPEVVVVLPAHKANLYSFVVFVGSVVVFGVPFAISWGTRMLWNGIYDFLTDWATLSAVIFGGMAAHEFLHAVVFAAFCKRGFGAVEFGINWKQLSPYVHCREALALRPYRLATFMPGLCLGLVPSAVALVIGNAWLLTFGFFFTAGAAGDFYSLLKLSRANPRYEVLDHPDEVGFILRARD